MRTICLIVYGMAILCDCGAILGVSEDDKALDQLVGVVVSNYSIHVGHDEGLAIVE